MSPGTSIESTTDWSKRGLNARSALGPAPALVLQYASAAIACELTAQGKRLLDKESFHRLCALHPEVKNVPRINVEGRSLLNTTDEEYRFSHFSIEEFLVVKAALGEASLVLRNRTAAAPPTDSMVRFVRGWVERPPLQRIDWSQAPAASTIGELGEHGRAWRRGLLLRALLTGVVEAHELSLPNEPSRAPPPLGDRTLSTEARFETTLTDLAGAYLQDLNLSSARLDGINLHCANLRGANLTGASLRNATLSSCDLSDAKLDDANLEGAVLVGSQLNGASHGNVSVRRANLA